MKRKIFKKGAHFVEIDSHEPRNIHEDGITYYNVYREEFGICGGVYFVSQHENESEAIEACETAETCQLKKGDRVRIKRGHCGEGTELEVMRTWIDGSGRECFNGRGFNVRGPYFAREVEKI